MKVLIIDDEPVSRRILKRLLSRFPDLELHEAADGESAWAKVEEVTPALILCDLSMPRMDGVTFLTKLRASPASAEVPVIVISATKERETVLRVRDLNIIDYLLKPFELAPTFARLERFLVPYIAEHRLRESRAPHEVQSATPEAQPAEVEAEKPPVTP